MAQHEFKNHLSFDKFEKLKKEDWFPHTIEGVKDQKKYEIVFYDEEKYYFMDQANPEQELHITYAELTDQSQYIIRQLAVIAPFILDQP